MSLSGVSTPDISPGRLWGLTTFFNPQRYRRRKVLYDIFRESSMGQGLRLLTVELVFGNAAFELSPDDAEILIQLRAGDDSIMWQKERLLNIGLGRLPPECSLVAWLDCDVLFDNPNWVRETTTLLRDYAVVQPFSISARLPYGKTTVDIYKANDPFYDRRPSSAYAWEHESPLNDYLLTGHTGFAWAARRALFDDIGFYDRMIVGGGDAVLASGFYGRTTYHLTHMLPPALVRDQQEWIRAMAARVGGSVTYNPGALFHLWHGRPIRRRTQKRLELLSEYSFNPGVDIGVDGNGCFVWSGANRDLRKKVARYFWLRNEDDSRLRESAFRAADAWGRVGKRAASGSVAAVRRVSESCREALAVCRMPGPEHRLSLIIMNWKRPQVVERIVSTYSGYRPVGDIVVWNNNSGCPLDLSRYPGVKLITCRHDAGLDSRWAAGLLADSDHLLIHDDDILMTEGQVASLFRRYLKNPKISHGVCGRNVRDMYTPRRAYGAVDIVLTTCLIVNRDYIAEYFRRVAMFDDLRGHGCGNGEDIVMNYVIRAVTGVRNMAYPISYDDGNGDALISMHSISRRPGHISVRNEIVRRCMEELTREPARLKTRSYGLTELAKMFPPAWTRYYLAPEEILRRENFSVSGNVSREKFAEALSLLCRRVVTAGEVVAGTDHDFVQK